MLIQKINSTTLFFSLFILDHKYILFNFFNLKMILFILGSPLAYIFFNILKTSFFYYFLYM